MESCFECIVQNTQESASEHNFEKFPCVKYKDKLGVILHKFECTDKNKGIYLVYIQIENREKIDILKKVVQNIEWETLQDALEHGLKDMNDEFSVIYLKWSVNNWKEVEYSLPKKKGTTGTWKVIESPKKDDITLVRALRHLV